MLPIPDELPSASDHGLDILPSSDLVAHFRDLRPPNPVPSTSRTPAQQVRDAYLASQVQGGDIAALRESVRSLFAKIQRDAMYNHDEDPFRDALVGEEHDWAEQDAIGQHSTVPFPRGENSSSTSGSSPLDGHESSQLDFGGVLESNARCGSSAAGSDLVNQFAESGAIGTITGETGARLRTDVQTQGPWSPRVRAVRLVLFASPSSQCRDGEVKATPDREEPQKAARYPTEDRTAYQAAVCKE
ncbi:hypothetical protein EIP86_000550 [Pleurotus ostreatoroseus]|nr:hypothetical protein EIP86_000550 [Pleurotus ostreatoroseus]